MNQPVGELIKSLSEIWPGSKWSIEDTSIPKAKEANLLKLICDKALNELELHSVMDFEETIKFTGDWFHTFYGNEQDSMYSFTQGQIDTYTKKSVEQDLKWTQSL